MPAFMELNEPLGPSHVHSFGMHTHMSEAHGLTHRLEQAGVILSIGYGESNFCHTCNSREPDKSCALN